MKRFFTDSSVLVFIYSSFPPLPLYCPPYPSQVNTTPFPFSPFFHFTAPVSYYPPS